MNPDRKLKQLLFIPSFLLPFICFILTSGKVVQAQEAGINAGGYLVAQELTIDASKNIMQGNTDQAAHELQEALRADSTFHEALRQMYLLWTTEKLYADMSVYHLQRGVKIYPDDDELWFYLAEIYRSLDRIPEAIEAYSQAITYSEINGTDFPLVPNYYLNRGNCYYYRNQFTKAIADYTRLLEIKPGFTPALSNRGICYFFTKKTDKACADWKRAISLGDDSQEEHYKKHCQKNPNTLINTKTEAAP